MDFIKELQALLSKYNATIGWTCGPCSDMHGVYDEEMYIQVGKSDYTVAGNYIDAHNLKENV